MDIAHLIAHPEELNQETLYDLRRIVAVFPTFHAARILFLQNLFLLHDTTFDQELRRAALLVPDRRVLCNITQFGGLQPMLDRTQSLAERRTTATTTAATTTNAEDEVSATDKYTPQADNTQTAIEPAPASTATPRRPRKKYTSEDTTLTLLDDFLSSTPAPLKKRRVKADPATDYMAYLTQFDEAESTDNSSHSDAQPSAFVPADNNTLRMDELIDGFITSYQNGIRLSENPDMPEDILTDNDETAPAESANTDAPAAPLDVTPDTADSTTLAATSEAGLSETLANIYIKQQKYERALEVMSKMQSTSKNNPYLADQVRFLQKLAINSRHKH